LFGGISAATSHLANIFRNELLLIIFHSTLNFRLHLIFRTDLKAQGSKLAQLDMAKADAVMAEDYDLAKEIKDESDLLRRQIEEQVGNNCVAIFLFCFCLYLYLFFCAKDYFR